MYIVVQILGRFAKGNGRQASTMWATRVNCGSLSACHDTGVMATVVRTLRRLLNNDDLLGFRTAVVVAFVHLLHDDWMGLTRGTLLFTPTDRAAVVTFVSQRVSVGTWRHTGDGCVTCFYCDGCRLLFTPRFTFSFKYMLLANSLLFFWSLIRIIRDKVVFLTPYFFVFLRKCS